MKTLHTYISEKLVLTNKSKIRKTTTCHPDYDKLQKTEPKLDFGDVEICDSISNFLWQFEKNGDVLKLDYPGFDHNVDSENPTEFNPSQLFKKKLEKCESLHSICHVLNEKWSDEDNLPDDDRWAFYACIAEFYEDCGLDLGEYHCKDMEHYIIYNDKHLTNRLLKGSWLK